MEAQTQALPQLNLQTVNVPVKYNFKSVVVKDAQDKPVMVPEEKDGKATGKMVEQKTKRDSFETMLPVPTLESLFGLAAPLPKVKVIDVAANAEKGIEEQSHEEYAHPEHKAIFELVQDYLADTGKAIVDETEQNDQISFPEGTFDFSKLSRKPKYERKGGTLQKELLEDLCDSYTKAMKEAGKPEKGIKIACHYFMKRAKGLDAVRQDIVEKMRANLGAWFTSIQEEEQGKFAAAYQLLDGRIGDALAEDAANVM